MSIRVKTTFLGATDTKGERIRVQSSATGVRHEFPYDYSARNAHTAAIRRAYGETVTIAYNGAHARGHWYVVT